MINRSRFIRRPSIAQFVPRIPRAGEFFRRRANRMNDRCRALCRVAAWRMRRRHRNRTPAGLSARNRDSGFYSKASRRGSFDENQPFRPCGQVQGCWFGNGVTSDWCRAFSERVFLTVTAAFARLRPVPFLLASGCVRYGRAGMSPSDGEPWKHLLLSLN